MRRSRRPQPRARSSTTSLRRAGTSSSTKRTIRARPWTSPLSSPTHLPRVAMSITCTQPGPSLSSTARSVRVSAARPFLDRCPPITDSRGRRPKRSAATRRRCVSLGISLTQRVIRTIVTSIRVRIPHRSRTATWSSSSTTATPRRATPTVSSSAWCAIRREVRRPAPRTCTAPHREGG